MQMTVSNNAAVEKLIFQINTRAIIRNVGK